MNARGPKTNQPKHKRTKHSREERLLRPRSEIVEQRRQRRRGIEGPSLEALAGAALGFSAGYLAIEGIMSDNRHPMHWVFTVVIAIVGYGVGHGVYRWRESH